MNNETLLDDVRQIAVEAGHGILDIYDRDYDIVSKSDGSPLTAADRRSHEIISARLSILTPEIPILSEESSSTDIAERRDWERLWVIDPLDGTKEFIKRNGEFTVNIALVDGGRPVLGVVYTPVKAMTHFAAEGRGAFRQQGEEAPESIRVGAYQGGPCRMVASRSHAGAAVTHFCEQLEAREGPVEKISMGSALKVCLVAEGAADVYPRLGPTSEWDTAASHCILEEAGGRLLNCSGEPLSYNKEDVLNPWFIALGGGDFDWLSLCSDIEKSEAHG